MINKGELANFTDEEQHLAEELYERSWPDRSTYVEFSYLELDQRQWWMRRARAKLRDKAYGKSGYHYTCMQVEAELTRAREKHRAMISQHEGYAVLLEEVDELWDEVKKKHFDKTAARTEAIQIAAMAVAFAVEVCGDGA